MRMKALLKFLGSIDLLAGVLLVLMLFGITPLTSLVAFAGATLLVKAFFPSFCVVGLIDLFAGLVLLISIHFTVPFSFVSLATLMLIAKGFLSFL